MLVALLWVGCDPNTGFCTELSCDSNITFEVLGPPDVTELVGNVSADGRTVDVDCPGASDQTVWCYEKYVSVFNGNLTFGTELTGGDVDWGFSIPGSGTGAFGGSGTVTPEFTPSYPNGEACGAACTYALATVTLEADK